MPCQDGEATEKNHDVRRAFEELAVVTVNAGVTSRFKSFARQLLSRWEAKSRRARLKVQKKNRVEEWSWGGPRLVRGVDPWRWL